MSILASVALAGASGCIVGDVPDPTTDPGTPNTNPGPGGSNQGLTEFNKSVSGMLRSNCATGCHEGAATDPAKFLGLDGANDDYSAIVSLASIHGNFSTTQASLITKLDLAGAAGHYGKQPWTADEKAKIQAWFDIEKASIGTGTPPATPGRVDTRTLLAEWAGCMDLANWNASNMGLWRNKGSGAGACGNCHSNGEFWINIATNSDTMFQMNKTEMFITGFFTAKMNADGTGEIIPAIDKLKRVGGGDPITRHPTFNTGANDQYILYLTDFYNKTKAARDAKTCAAPGFPTPAPATPPPAQ
jgi:hypothetical protein